MALTPEQVELGPEADRPLSAEETAQIGEMEERIDQGLLRNPPTNSVTMSLPGELSPAVQAELARRYRNAGWRGVKIEDNGSNYQITLRATPA